MRRGYSLAQYYDEFQLYTTQLRDAIPSQTAQPPREAPQDGGSRG